MKKSINCTRALLDKFGGISQNVRHLIDCKTMGLTVDDEENLN